MIGSPPHPRGIFNSLLLCSRYIRFTPASAGNIASSNVIGLTLQVHPRIRGEYSAPSQMISVGTGSPPHPRGISSGKLDQDGNDRFTPASAGNIVIDVLMGLIT